MPPVKRAKATVRYELDALNRLILHDPRDAAQPRRVVEGDLRIDEANRLVYRVRHTPQMDGREPAQDYVFDGEWRLTGDHRLALAIREREEDRRQTLVLNGALVEARDNALGISLTQRGLDGEPVAQRLSLSGRWQADPRNRLAFLLNKAQGDPDRLVFDGAWTVDDHHELRYEYRQRATSRREAVTHTLTFAGSWDVAEASRLVYRLDADSRSAFAFQAAVQSRSLNARDGTLVYQIGIRLSGGRTVNRRVTLFGIWKLNRDVSVAFEVPYADGRLEALTFTGSVTVKDRNTIAVALSDRRGEPLAVSVTFTRQFLDDAELFVRLQRSAEDTAVFGGVRVRF